MRRVELAVLRRRQERRPHKAQIAQQLDRASLFRRRPIVELHDVELAGEVEQNPNLFVQRGGRALIW
jgi:hypothetical protein